MPTETTPISCPVTMIIFNREDNARQVFEQIKKVQPPKLFVIADGPRENKIGEKELCEKTRSIIQDVDWPCEVITNFAEKNMGCKDRISSGLTWVFSQTESSIILEDDCCPSLSFFYYCEEMLEKYKDDERISMVSGNNHTFSNSKTIGAVTDSYYFSKHVHIWGWATWARAWNYYDLEVTQWPEFKKQKKLSEFLTKKSYKYFWEAMFDHYYKKRIPSWDGAWVFAVWLQNGLAIAPSVNLIQNTGISADATHTTTEDIYSRLKAEELDFPLKHPKVIEENRLLDNREMKIRLKTMRRLPYPLCKWASEIKWFLKDLKK